MDDRFFERPILNSPYEYPARVAPFRSVHHAHPQAPEHKGRAGQVSTTAQQYDPTSHINELRGPTLPGAPGERER